LPFQLIFDPETHHLNLVGFCCFPSRVGVGMKKGVAVSMHLSSLNPPPESGGFRGSAKENSKQWFRWVAGQLNYLIQQGVPDAPPPTLQKNLAS
jgi:hypothetical protein